MTATPVQQEAVSALCDGFGIENTHTQTIGDNIIVVVGENGWRFPVGPDGWIVDLPDGLPPETIAGIRLDLQAVHAAPLAAVENR